MLELTINGTVYGFKFGMGFMRKLNAELKQPVDGLKNVEQNVGLRYKLANVMENDIEALVDVLFAANATENPRVTRNLLDDYIDDENTDIDDLFKTTLDFLRQANATRGAMKALDELAEQQKAKAKREAANA